jgi:hypothetical protein
MLLMYIRRAILIAVVAGSCYFLAELLGPWLVFLIWGTVAAVGCAVGTVLLRTSKIGQITWKNWVAGYLIPWGWRLNRGQLWPIPFISWSVWMVIGMSAVLLQQGGERIEFRIALYASWAAQASALLFILGSIRQATPGGRTRSMWKLVAILSLLIVVSLGLYLNSMPNAALIVAGGPVLVAGVCVGAVLLVFATVGRNARWN